VKEHFEIINGFPDEIKKIENLKEVERCRVVGCWLSVGRLSFSVVALSVVGLSLSVVGCRLSVVGWSVLGEL